MYRMNLAEEIKHTKTNDKMSQILFEIVYKHVRDLVFIMKVEEGPRFIYWFVNETAMDIARLSLDCIGRDLFEVLHEKKAQLLYKEYMNILLTKKSGQFDDEIDLPSGKSSFGESILTPVMDEDGQIQYVVAVTRDVTDAVHEKNLLKESEQRFRSMFDHNLDGIFTIDLNGKIVKANRAVDKMTGYAFNELIGYSIFNLFPEQHQNELQKLLRTTQKGEASESIHFHIQNKQRKLIIVQLKTVPIIIRDSVIGIYIIFRDISQQTENIAKIEHMAYHDQLTNLYNRRALVKDLQEAITHCNTYETQFAVFYIDLDRFKYLNDTMGHIVGDMVLNRVAKRLTSLKAENYSVYRQGGDEFIILLKNATKQKATHFAQKVLSTFAIPFIIDQDEYFLSLSIGISLYPDDGTDANVIVKNADRALFQVKEAGKGHFQFFKHNQVDSVKNFMLIEGYLRKAIQRNELFIVYQPQVDLQTNEIKSFEALLRWKNEEYGLVSPADFIPLAEETGLIIEIGEWVFNEVCYQLADWQSKNLATKRVAINLSPKQFQHPCLVEMIERCMENHGINSSMIEIEITEGALMNTKETLQVLNRLENIGICITVDDFGTGYSSLNYIKQFPLNILKVDQSFVKDVITDQKNAAITTTIIHLANSLGLKVIAEGVENQEQVDFLIRANCQTGQGYLFSKPILAKEVEEKWLQSNHKI